MDPADRFVLVLPRKSYLFADSVNLKLLKKQLEVLGKQAAIMTMDEKGQAFTHEAGFTVLDVPKRSVGQKLSDIRVAKKPEFKSAVVPEVKAKTVHTTVAKKTPPKEAPEKPEEKVRSTIEIKHTKSPEPKPRAYKTPSLEVSESIFDEVPHKPSNGNLPTLPGRKNKWLWRLLVLAIICAGLAFLLTVVLPKATISITPKTENLTRQMELIASTQTASPQAQTLQLPAEFYETKLDETQSVDTLGKKELGTKAAGAVRIFNLTGSSLNLKANTTKLVSDGKTFLLTKDALYIPSLSAKAATAPNAGFLVQVEAASVGDNHNLASGTKLNIENQVFGSKPEVLYAIVEDNLTGGSSRFISEVQEIDRENARKVLIASAMEKIAEDLKKQGKILPEGAYVLEDEKLTLEPNLGTEATSYKASLSGKLSGLTFKPEQMISLARTRIEQAKPANTSLQDQAKDKLTFKISDPNLQSGSMKISLSLESKIYKQVDLSSLEGKLPNQNVDQAIKTLKSQSDIAEVSISIFPKQRKALPIWSKRISYLYLKP